MQPPDLPAVPQRPDPPMPGEPMLVVSSGEPPQPSGRRWGVLIGVTAAVVAALVAVALILSSVSKDANDDAGSGAGAGLAAGPGSSPAALVERWDGEGVSIELPQGWTADAGTDGLPDMLQQTLATQPMFGELVKLGGHGPDATQLLMIISTPSVPGMPPTALADQIVAGITGQTDGQVSKREDTTVDGHPATRIEFSGVNALVSAVTYTWDDGSDVWIAMWIAPNAALEGWGSTYDAAMQTVTTSAP